MTQGTHLFYVEHVSGGNMSVDYIEFDSLDSSVEPTSWGSIKALYR